MGWDGRMRRGESEMGEGGSGKGVVGVDEAALS